MRRASLRIGIAAAVALSGAAAGAQTSPLWGALRPGPHAVGFKVVTGYDYTRVARRKAGAADTTERAAPSVIAMWYPARAAAGGGGRGAALTFADYQAAGAYQGALAEPDARRLRAADSGLKAFYERPQNFTAGPVPDERWQRLRRTATAARREAPAAAGRFPLVMGSGAPLTHAVQGEYLASHGYVVALALPMGAGANGVLGTEQLVREQEHLLAVMRAQPNVDRNGLGLIGFSFAGFPALTLAMRNTDVDAVVLLESGVFSPQFAASLKPSPFYDVTRLRAPLMYAVRSTLHRDLDRPEPLDSLRFSRRLVWLVNDSTTVHQDFGTHGIASAAVLEMRGAGRTAATRTFETVTEQLHRFLDAYVKRDPAALAALDRAPEELGVPRGLVTIQRKEAARPAPTPAEFVAMIDQQGIAAALRALEQGRRDDSAADLFREPTLNAIGYQLLQRSLVKEAIEVFKVNVAAYPRSANVYDSLSEAYEVDGDRARAIEYAERAVRALPDDAALTEAARAGIATAANDRLRRLRGGTE